ncbi:MAG TPA: hypothetical protein VF692_04175 [Pyrinomonadaceae bacterium]
MPGTNPVLAQQKRIVTVTADQPNIWTLEQAHYLLAQMHRRNLDLKAKGLNPLDANEINGINIDVLRTLLEVGATYNEADRFNNNLIERDKTFNTERRRQLIQDLDGLQEETVNLTRTIARLKREKETAESADEKARIEAEILEKTEVKAAVDKQIESKNTELSKLSPASGNVTATSSSAAFDPKKFPSGGFDETFRKKAAEIIEGFKTNPQLNASLQLDNFLQLQYEIISKQLTLLRDEVGPGEQLIFLELPQSINAAYDKSDDMWAQSRWRIAGFTRCELIVGGESVPCQKVLGTSADRPQNQPPRTSSDVLNSIRNTPTVFDKFHFTSFEVADVQGLSKKLYSLTDSSEKGLYQSFISNNTLFTNFTDVNEKQKIEEFQKDLRLLSQIRENRESMEKELANCLKCTDAEKSKIIAKLNELNESEKNIEKQAARHSENLLGVTLKILNKMIDFPEKLNSIPQINKTLLSPRTKVLANVKADDVQSRLLLNRLWIEDFFSNDVYRLREDDFSTKFIKLVSDMPINGTTEFTAEDRQVRTIELIPRQSSFNVNDVKIRNKSGAFNFIASFLFGFGANLNYQRQRERYSQFVQQELYSSAFGKGARDFGWTFTSMPGTDKLLSGQRTTYAIAIVPQEASSIVLEATGCAFDRTARQPDSFDEAKKDEWKNGVRNSCSQPKNFIVAIPGGGYDSSNDFFVSGLRYEPVDKGKRIVVSIYGNNFSSQIGVMINGISLPASIGIAQRFILDDSKVGEKVYEAFSKETVRGGFERVDANQIVASFEMVGGEEGTPIITLVSPGKAVDLNALSNLYINRERNKKLSDSEWMFGKKPSFQIKDVQIFNNGLGQDGKVQLTALITKSSRGTINNVFVNGEDTGKLTFGANNVVQVKFPAPNDDRIHLVIVSGEETYKLTPMANPAKAPAPKDPPSYNANELSFSVGETRAIFTDAKQEKIAYLLVEIQGTGLTPGLNVSVGQLDVVNGSKAYITIPDPKPAQTVRLTDAKNNRFAEGVVVVPKWTPPVPRPTATPVQSANP